MSVGFGASGPPDCLVHSGQRIGRVGLNIKENATEKAGERGIRATTNWSEIPH